MWLGIDIGTGSSRALLVDESGAVRGGYTATARRHAAWSSPCGPSSVPKTGGTRPWKRFAACWRRAAFRGSGGEGHRAFRADARAGDPGRAQPRDPPVADLVRPAQPGRRWTRSTLSWAAKRSSRYIANPVLTGFTLPKLLWVRDHEPRHFERVRKMLLPKDYVRFRLTGEFATRGIGRLRHGGLRRGEPALVLRNDGRAGPRPRDPAAVLRIERSHRRDHAAGGRH